VAAHSNGCVPERGAGGLAERYVLAFIVLALVLTIVFRSRLVRWRRHKRLRGERERTKDTRSLWAATRAAQTTAARARAMAEFSPSRTTDPPTGEPKA